MKWLSLPKAPECDKYTSKANPKCYSKIKSFLKCLFGEEVFHVAY